MLTKILFTLMVIIGVAIFYRNKGMARAASKPAPEATTDNAPSTRTVAYILIALLVVISAGIFIYHRQQDNRIINIRVTADSGDIINYQARHKDIRGRSFISLEGVTVDLGEGDRVEMLSE